MTVIYSGQADELERLTADCSPARFGVLRRANAELVSEVDEEVWNYAGQHDEYGLMTLREWIEDYAGHTAKHLDQIRAVADEFAQTKGSQNG